MDIAYIVKIKVSDEVYETYKRWIQSHVEGNAAIGIRGMMEIFHEGKMLFPSVELFTSGEIDGFHLIAIHYYTNSIQNIKDYLSHYAAGMREEFPEEFFSNTAINRFISKGNSVIPVGKTDNDLEALYQKNTEKIYNYASFEVYI